MSDGMRLFLGVRVSMATVAALQEQVRALRDTARDGGPRVRWVSPASYHVTLKFLGWARAPIVDALRDQVPPAIAGVRPFEVTCEQLGAFPSPARARVLWAGVTDPAGSLAKLAAALDDVAGGLGFNKENRAFHAHVTIGRVKEVADVTPLLQSGTEHRYSTSMIDSVQLYQSITSPDGAEYPVLRSWPL